MKNIVNILRGSLSLFLMLVNTIFWCVPLYTVAILKLIVPLKPWRALCSKILVSISTAWISVNNANLRLLNPIKWDLEGVENLDMNDWYLVLSNHQTWVDIIVLQKIFNRRIPFLKFFIKKELLWVPFLGLAWWALDYPVMMRYSKDFLEKNPHLKGKDIETTKMACEKFRTMPVSIMNFVEGTRFTPDKHARQNSPYNHLLRPKAAGVAFVLTAMGDQVRNILDVTIAYPGGARNFWDFLCGGVEKVMVRVERLPILEDIVGDYHEDEYFRRQFQNWLNTLWDKKDENLEMLLEG